MSTRNNLQKYLIFRLPLILSLILGACKLTPSSQESAESLSYQPVEI